MILKQYLKRLNYTQHKKKEHLLKKNYVIYQIKDKFLLYKDI